MTVHDPLDATDVEPHDFRAAIRAWIGSNAPDGLATEVDWYAGTTILAGANSALAAARDAATESPVHQEWERRLLDARLVCPQWPEAVGGRGWGPLHVAIFAEECRSAGVPRVKRGLGEGLVGPAVLLHGTDDQIHRLLPAIISGAHRYCQGFSEPDHGSDLAGISTRGEIDGAELVITGQKVWTSVYHQANKMFVLCRTDPCVSKHKGLTFALIDFTPENGVDAKPIRQLTGSEEFGHVFLEGARGPLDDIIGGLGNGWGVALSTLNYERTDGATFAHRAFADELDELIEVARKNGSVTDPRIRQELAWAYTHVSLMRYQAIRVAESLARAEGPGPEALTSKLFWSEYHRRFGELALRVLQADALIRPAGAQYSTTPWQDVFMASRAATIFSGTSQIQRNVIAERLLGLPKEPAS